jgi:hypothetical protein
MHGSLPPSLKGKIESDTLQPVDTILLLQSSPLLTRATAAQLVGLAAIAHPVDLTPGADPFSGPDSTTLVVLSGSVLIERDGAAAETAGPGDVVGIYETLGGVDFPVRAEVLTAGRGLRFIRSEVLDVLADDVGLLRGIFSGLLRVPEATPTPHAHE